jgi:glycosyltransferase involved in cell wall biosynthesis
MVHPSQPAPVTGLRIALLGSRGIPASYGGYETLMEELSTRLVARGHEVTVYCRSQYTSKAMTEYRGVKLAVLPTIRTKHLDTPVHTLASCLHAAERNFDAALMVNGANAIFVPLLRSAAIPVALHVDGIERRRAKWGVVGKTVYAISERLATRVPDVLITDAKVVRDYYLENWQTDSTIITYGVTPRFEKAGETLRQLGLQAGRYLLYVSRFEPENNPHRVADAYRQVAGEVPLVMVGGAPYAEDFVTGFTQNADPRVIFPGPVYGRGYRELLTHALGYIHATEVGGTHPALVEAMGYGNPVIVNDTPENREVAGPDAMYFRASSSADLADVLEQFLASGPEQRQRLADLAQLRASQHYHWDQVVDDYERVFRHLARSTRVG